MAKKQNDAPQTNAVQPTKEQLAIDTAKAFIVKFNELKETFNEFNAAHIAQTIDVRQSQNIELEKNFSKAELRILRNSNLYSVLKSL